MAIYTVTVSKLNRRKGPVTDFEEKSNVIGEIFRGATIEIVGEISNTLGKWLQDKAGNYYWAGGLTDLAAHTNNNAPQADWWLNQLEIQSLWLNYKEKGQNAKIAVLDSGYNTSIQDLADSVVESKVFSGNGQGSIEDVYGHGTHCASLISGKNENFITSCAPDSSLYIAKISNQGSAKSFAVIVNAIKWAIEKGVHVISISNGSDVRDAALEAIIQSAVVDHNIVVVAAIGNNTDGSANLPHYPALYKECIAVGATNRDRQIAKITIPSNKIEINCPGENILGYHLSNQLQPMTGSSQATAIVAGVCALIISRYKSLGRSYTAETIRQLILENADSIQGTNQKLLNPVNIFSKIEHHEQPT